MLVKRISETQREQIVYSLMLNAENEETQLILGRKRHLHLYNVEAGNVSKGADQLPPEATSSCEFKDDIIELRSFGKDVLVVLDNLHIYYVKVTSNDISKHFAGRIQPLTDSAVVRIKYTSLTISNNSDFGLLSVFCNSLVVLYLSKEEEENKQSEDSSSLSIQSTYKYYDHQVNSSLLIMDYAEDGE